ALTGPVPVMVTVEDALPLELSVAVTPSAFWPMLAVTCWKKLLAASMVARLLFTLTPVMDAPEVDVDAVPLTSTGFPCGKLLPAGGACTVTVTGSVMPSGCWLPGSSTKLEVAGCVPEVQALPFW